jgi:hypothetical protein
MLALMIRAVVFSLIMVVACVAAFLMLVLGANGWLVMAFLFACGAIALDLGDRLVRPR